MFPHENSQFLIPGPAGDLEIMTTWPHLADPLGIGIICHPDPRQGGTMNNKVVTTLARAFIELNLATVRFNFRGIGNSSGEYGHTQGELADLNAVIAWAKQQLPALPLWLAGFSFGSYISALAAPAAKPRALISIAPPVNRYDFNQLTQISCPWLVIQGDQDEVVPYAEVQAWAAQPPAPLKLITMTGATHFFHGRLIELRDYTEQWARLL
jgi:uncharacterized protein